MTHKHFVRAQDTTKPSKYVRCVSGFATDLYNQPLRQTRHELPSRALVAGRHTPRIYARSSTRSWGEGSGGGLVICWKKEEDLVLWAFPNLRLTVHDTFNSMSLPCLIALAKVRLTVNKTDRQSELQ